MDAVRILLLMLCAGIVGGSGLLNSGALKDGGMVEKGLGTGGLQNPAKGQSAAAIVRAAQKEIGVQETGENTGERVDQYNAYVGLRKVAWCAAFVSWCHGQAGYPEPRTAWSPALFPSGRLSQKATPGMVLGIYYPQLKRIGHCGVVERLQGDFVVSIEGNTNGNGGREGEGVFRRIRHKRTIAKYATWLGATIMLNRRNGS